MSMLDGYCKLFISTVLLFWPLHQLSFIWINKRGLKKIKKRFMLQSKRLISGFGLGIAKFMSWDEAQMFLFCHYFITVLLNDWYLIAASKVNFRFLLFFFFPSEAQVEVLSLFSNQLSVLFSSSSLFVVWFRSAPWHHLSP